MEREIEDLVVLTQIFKRLSLLIKIDNKIKYTKVLFESRHFFFFLFKLSRLVLCSNKE